MSSAQTSAVGAKTLVKCWSTARASLLGSGAVQSSLGYHHVERQMVAHPAELEIPELIVHSSLQCGIVDERKG